MSQTPVYKWVWVLCTCSLICQVFGSSCHLLQPVLSTQR